MRYLLSLILALAILLPSLAQAYEVLVLQSRRDPVYDEVLKGFRSQRRFTERLIVLSDYSEVDVIRIVREDRPSLVLTLGDSALSEARKVRQIPVISLMSLAIHHLKGGDNISGIGMYVSAERYLKLFQAMRSRRVGVIHNPAKSGWYLQDARMAAEQANIELVVREVKNPRETIDQLTSLAGKVDCLWMLPDSTAVTRETAEAYFRFAQEQNVPLISFAGPYLGLGAAAVVEIDLTQLGRQANDMAVSALRGNSNRLVSRPGKTRIKTNLSVLKRLGISAMHIEANLNNLDE